MEWKQQTSCSSTLQTVATLKMSRPLPLPHPKHLQWSKKWRRRSRLLFSLSTSIEREVESGPVAPHLLLPRHLSLSSPGLRVRSRPLRHSRFPKMEVIGCWGNSASSYALMLRFWVRFPLTVYSLPSTRRQPLANHEPVHLFEIFSFIFLFRWMINKLARKYHRKKNHPYFSRNTAPLDITKGPDTSWVPGCQVSVDSSQVTAVSLQTSGSSNRFKKQRRPSKLSAKQAESKAAVSWMSLERMNWLWLSAGCRMLIDKWGLC